MDFQEALNYLNSFSYNEINPGLERIATLLLGLGNPHLNYEAIQITGTNGKTSTARILFNTLRVHGKKAGLYTSPHLLLPTERYEIDGRPVDEADFAAALTHLKPHVERLNERISPDSVSYFELTTALAFYLFDLFGIDLAVLEVGMGGRWDATSISLPKVSVITNVTLDHTDRLGQTVAEIAFEKAHIIKEGGLAIVGDLSLDAMEVVRERCDKMGASLRVLGRDFFLRDRERNFSIAGLFGDYDDLELGLLGEHQKKNATLAAVAAEATLGGPLDSSKLKEVLISATSPGRLEIVRENPTLILDGAHNVDGARQLVKYLKSGLKFDELYLIVAILGDKDVEGILAELGSLDATFILTKNKNDRSSLPKRMARSLKARRLLCTPSVETAIEAAMKRASKTSLICVTGSLSTVAEAKAFIKKGGLFG